MVELYQLPDQLTDECLEFAHRLFTAARGGSSGHRIPCATAALAVLCAGDTIVDRRPDGRCGTVSVQVSGDFTEFERLFWGSAEFFCT